MHQVRTDNIQKLTWAMKKAKRAWPSTRQILHITKAKTGRTNLEANKRSTTKNTHISYTNQPAKLSSRSSSSVMWWVHRTLRVQRVEEVLAHQCRVVILICCSNNSHPSLKTHCPRWTKHTRPTKVYRVLYLTLTTLKSNKTKIKNRKSKIKS